MGMYWPAVPLVCWDLWYSKDLFVTQYHNLCWGPHVKDIFFFAGIDMLQGLILLSSVRANSTQWLLLQVQVSCIVIVVRTRYLHIFWSTIRGMKLWYGLMGLILGWGAFCVLRFLLSQAHNCSTKFLVLAFLWQLGNCSSLPGGVVACINTYCIYGWKWKVCRSRKYSRRGHAESTAWPLHDHVCKREWVESPQHHCGPGPVLEFLSTTVKYSHQLCLKHLTVQARCVEICPKFH